MLILEPLYNYYATVVYGTTGWRHQLFEFGAIIINTMHAPEDELILQYRGSGLEYEARHFKTLKRTNIKHKRMEELSWGSDDGSNVWNQQALRFGALNV